MAEFIRLYLLDMLPLRKLDMRLYSWLNRAVPCGMLYGDGLRLLTTFFRTSDIIWFYGRKDKAERRAHSPLNTAELSCRLGLSEVTFNSYYKSNPMRGSMST